jgi:putative ABC transport system ATP-binding protein
MANPVIETVGLSKQYRIGVQTISALSDLTVSIDPGEFVAIMGPSGSGKSTCMHLLGCLQSPSAGHYRFDGEDVSALDSNTLAETRNAKVGVLFQSFYLLPRLSALHNVELPLMYGQTRRRYRRALAEEALCAAGLEDRMQHRPDQLSGGQMQRVALARALVNRPRLVLADEPTGALDSETGREIMELFSRLNTEGITIVVVTHNEEVARYAKRILRFRDGKMIADEVRE